MLLPYVLHFSDWVTILSPYPSCASLCSLVLGCFSDFLKAFNAKTLCRGNIWWWLLGWCHHHRFFDIGTGLKQRKFKYAPRMVILKISKSILFQQLIGKTKIDLRK